MPPIHPHIAIYIPDMSGGGVERQKITLIPALQELGYRITLILHNKKGDLLHALPHDVSLHVLHCRGALTAIPGLIHFMNKERPSILLSSLGHNNIAALIAHRLSIKKTKVIICQHNSLRHETSWTIKREEGASFLTCVRYALLPLLTRLLAPYAAGIVAVSCGVADDMARLCRIPRERISVIYNPVIAPDFHKKMDAPSPEHPFLSDQSVPFLIAIGRLVPQKNYPLLLHTVAIALQTTNFRLLILGSGPEKDRLVHYAHTLGIEKNVMFMGFLENPLPLLRHADLFVLSSRYEGFGNVIVEALAAGTPVISTDCPYGPSEILQNGRWGTLVPFDSPHPMAQAILYHLTNPVRHREAEKNYGLSFNSTQSAAAYNALFIKTLS